MTKYSFLLLVLIFSALNVHVESKNLFDILVTCYDIADADKVEATATIEVRFPGTEEWKPVGKAEAEKKEHNPHFLPISASMSVSKNPEFKLTIATKGGQNRFLGEAFTDYESIRRGGKNKHRLQISLYKRGSKKKSGGVCKLQVKDSATKSAADRSPRNSKSKHQRPPRRRIDNESDGDTSDDGKDTYRARGRSDAQEFSDETSEEDKYAENFRGAPPHGYNQGLPYYGHNQQYPFPPAQGGHPGYVQPPPPQYGQPAPRYDSSVGAKVEFNIKCRGLGNIGGWFRKSDPYIVLEVSDYGRWKYLDKTEVQSNNFDPQFRPLEPKYTFTGNPLLKFTVKDKNSFERDGLMGEVFVGLHDVLQASSRGLELQLLQIGKREAAQGACIVSAKARQTYATGPGGQVMPNYGINDRDLEGIFEFSIQCFDLVNYDGPGGRSDPYVILEVKDDNRWLPLGSTEVKKNNHEPKFKSFEGKHTFKGNQDIKLTLMDKDTFTGDDFMGESYTDLKEILKGDGYDLPILLQLYKKGTDKELPGTCSIEAVRIGGGNFLPIHGGGPDAGLESRPEVTYNGGYHAHQGYMPGYAAGYGNVGGYQGGGGSRPWCGNGGGAYPSGCGGGYGAGYGNGGGYQGADGSRPRHGNSGGAYSASFGGGYGAEFGNGGGGHGHGRRRKEKAKLRRRASHGANSAATYDAPPGYPTGRK